MKIINILILALFSVIAAEAVTVNQYQIGQQTTFTIQAHCLAFKLNMNYKQTSISVQGQTNISQFLYTDVPINNCDELSTLTCASNSMICGNLPTQGDFNTKIGVCMKDLYFYALRSTSAEEATATIHPQYINDAPCISAGSQTYANCASFGIEACTKNSVCDANCMEVDCGGGQNSSSIFKMCLPTSASDSELVSRCKGHKLLMNLPDNEVKITKANCQDPKHYVKALSSNSIALLSILVIVLIIFLAVTICYNVKLLQNGTPPFKIPGFCPECLFPKKTDSTQGYYRPEEGELR